VQSEREREKAREAAVPFSNVRGSQATNPSVLRSEEKRSYRRHIRFAIWEEMSGLGPAACWLAHKRIESWSRMAKERVGAVRRVTLDRNSADEGSPSGSGSSSTTGGASVSGGNGSSVVHILPMGEGSTTPPPQPMTPPPSASSVTSTTSGIGSVSAGSVSDSCDLPTDSEVPKSGAYF